MPGKDALATESLRTLGVFDGMARSGKREAPSYSRTLRIRQRFERRKRHMQPLAPKFSRHIGP
jgi:hypothetical protein